MGASLRDHRGAAPGVAGVPTSLQPDWEEGQPEAGDLAAFNERYDQLFPKAFRQSVSSPGSQAEVVVQ